MLITPIGTPSAQVELEAMLTRVESEPQTAKEHACQVSLELSWQ